MIAFRRKARNFFGPSVDPREEIAGILRLLEKIGEGMKRSAVILFSLALQAGAAFPDVEFTPGTKIHLASVEEGREILTRRDDFIRALSPFDRAVRLKRRRAVPEREFLAYISKQVLPFSEKERERLKAAFQSLREKTSGFRYKLPSTITIVKTTGNEEAGAAYCRGNAIVFPASMLNRPGSSLERTALHELFHIVTRNNPDLRKSLYGVLGFLPCNEIEVPGELKEIKITNPDAARNNFYIELEYGGRKVPVIPILLSSSKNYEGGNLFRYLRLKFLVLGKKGSRWVPLYRDGKAWLLEGEVMPSYLARIGSNTSYIIHPEETLAENFILLVNRAEGVPTPRILTEMRNLLEKSK
jgi:hypothetical protein